jgi:hypothetical protein
MAPYLFDPHPANTCFTSAQPPPFSPPPLSMLEHDLALHMTQCKAARTSFFRARCVAESMEVFVRGRFVTILTAAMMISAAVSIASSFLS